jgi:hypothetical protein
VKGKPDVLKDVRIDELHSAVELPDPFLYTYPGFVTAELAPWKKTVSSGGRAESHSVRTTLKRTALSEAHTG